MKPRIYLETTAVSYLVARPTRDLVVAAHQQITREWWETRRNQFELYVSQSVVREAGAGDTEAASLRLQVIAELPTLTATEEALKLAEALVARRALPPRAEEDALHVATAAIHGMDYLLTWNCRHIANAEAQQAMASVCLLFGYAMPVICTPEELMGD